MKRLITQLALLIAVLCASIPAHAYDYIVDGIYYNVNKSNRTAEVTKGDGKYKGSINIPESITYEGSSYSVTSIGSGAFRYCRGLTSVTIPNSVTSIGEHAFYGCSGLTSVTIPNSVTSIGASAFSGCSGLTSVTIPHSVTSIGRSAFSGCSGLTSVTIGNSVTSIGEFAFYDCTGLTSVTIPNSVTSIGELAFGYCSGLTSIVVDKGNVNYDSRDNCNAIIETATNTLITGCKKTIIPNSVTSIGNGAFYGCSGLTSVTIPNSVTSIGKSAFSNCSGLTSIVVDEENKNYDSRDNCNAIIETATNTLITGCNSTIIPNSVTSIDYYAFSGRSGLTSVTIPNSVTSIGEGAFWLCSGLTSVTIPNSVTSIGSFAFHGCTGLTSVTIGNSVTSIGDGAFRACSGLTSVTIPNSVTIIGGNAFYNCKGLTSVTFNAEKCETMGSSEYFVFEGCTKLSTVTVGKDVVMILAYAFKGCTSLTKLYSAARRPPVCGDYALTDIDKSKCTLYVLKESVNLYKIADQWKVFYNVSEYDGVDDITVDADDAETLYDVYNIQGMKVGSGLRRAEMSDALPHGIYILVSPNATRKIRL